MAEDLQQSKPRKPWERQPGEPPGSYVRFCTYRDMLPEKRSLTKAVHVWLTGPLATTEGRGRPHQERIRQRRRYVTHPRKGLYSRMLRWSWGHYSVNGHWRVRVLAFDDHQEALRRQAADDAAIQTAITEAEENERHRGLRLQEARQLASAAQGGVLTAAPVALARLRAAQDEVRALIAGNASPEIAIRRVTAAVGDAVAVLNWATKSLDTAHKLEALALGKATSRTVVQFAPEMIDRLVRIIIAHSPEDQWEAVGAEVAAVLRGDRDDGTL